MRRTLLAAALLLLALPGAASAAPPPGALVQPAPPFACFDNDGAGGCTAIPKRFLNGASGVAVAPDGRSVHVASTLGASFTLHRDPGTGNLTNETAPIGFIDATSVAVAPDGRQVFFGQEDHGNGAGGVFDIDRNPATGLTGTIVHCTQEAGPGSFVVCQDGAGLTDVQEVAVSPDGKTLYAAGANGATGGALSAHSIAADGTLEEIDCRPSVPAASGPCKVTGNKAVGSANSVAVSPDGRFIYVLAADQGSLVGFNRVTGGPDTGKIGTVANCVARAPGNDEPFCQKVPGMSRPLGLAISPDGADIYVASLDHGISHFRRNSTSGVVTGGECRGSEFAGCATDPVADSGFRDVEISPDGRVVYAAGGNVVDGYVQAYTRDAFTGKLTPLACVSELSLNGCASVAGLRSATSLAVSGDGHDLYVGTAEGPGGTGSVAAFHIVQPEQQAAPPVSPGTTPADPAPAGAAPTPPANPPAVIDGKPAARVAAPKGRVKASKLKSVSGTASDDNRVESVSVAVVRITKNTCEVLVANGRLKKVRVKNGKCEAAGFLSAKGTTRWSLKLKRKLPRGKYVAFARATDSAGQTGTVARRTFAVR